MEKKPPTTQIHSELASKVMHRIEEEHIEPVPGWRFTVPNVILWFAWVVSIIVGSISVAAGIFVVANAGWDYYSTTHDTFLVFFVESLPYFWLIVMTLFILLAYENIRHTKRGYRFHITSILILSIGVSLAGGSILYFSGVGHVFDQHVAATLPFRTPVIEYQKKLWENPDRGLLAGEINMISEDAQWFTMNTFGGERWKIYTEELYEEDFNIIAEYPEIRVLGVQDETLESNELYACIIFPWQVVSPAKTFDSRLPHPVRLNINCQHKDCEINSEDKRNTRCKDVRPFEPLQIIHQ